MFCRLNGFKMDALKKIVYNEFDHAALQEALKDYRYPKDKITKLVKKNRIISMKKGVYIHGPDYRKNDISLEILANMLFGPSYVSMEYALSYYGMIPERPEIITSVTPKRKKEFNTPLGRFVYYAMHINYYRIGYKWEKIPDGRGYFIATPEKALIDKLYFETAAHSVREMLSLLLENLRIEEDSLRNLDVNLMVTILKNYKKKSLLNLVKALKRL